MYLESGITCRGEECGALTYDSAMDLVKIGSTAYCEVRIL